MTERKTIAAPATPLAPGGIGIVRISGADALRIADIVFKASNGRLLSQSEGYRAYHGTVSDAQSAVDEAVCLVFRAPHSYTGEDVAEISCHGGPYIVKRTLNAVLEAGAVPAEPGEFTKRAFQNGKIDLTRAEAVMSLISAHGRSAASAAYGVLEGRLGREIDSIAQSLAEFSAHLSAWVDYPDEDIEELSRGRLIASFSELGGRLDALLASFENGRALTSGVSAAIVGRPNVGKSTLMNLLSGCERSIVTPEAGTTRDVVEETVVLGDVVLRLSDTAGIREAETGAERIGVERAKRRLEEAELVLAVLDGSEPLSEEDMELLRLCDSRRTIVVVNKADLPQSIELEWMRAAAVRTAELSASTGEGLEELERAVIEVLGAARFDPNAATLISERQRDCCRRARELVGQAGEALGGGTTLDAVSVLNDAAVDALLELTGKTAAQAVVDEVFSRFCVGK